MYFLLFLKKKENPGCSLQWLRFHSNQKYIHLRHLTVRFASKVLLIRYFAIIGLIESIGGRPLKINCASVNDIILKDNVD